MPVSLDEQLALRDKIRQSYESLWSEISLKGWNESRRIWWRTILRDCNNFRKQFDYDPLSG